MPSMFRMLLTVAASLGLIQVGSAAYARPASDFEMSDFEAGDYRANEQKQIEVKKAAPKAHPGDKTAAIKAASAKTPLKAVAPPVVPVRPPSAPPVRNSAIVTTRPVSAPQISVPPGRQRSREEPPIVQHPVIQPATAKAPPITAPAMSPPIFAPVAGPPTIAPTVFDTPHPAPVETAVKTDPAPIVSIHQFLDSRTVLLRLNQSDYADWVGLDEGRQYMLSLINRDRKANGLNPVELDKIATIAGQAHSDDMASSRYVSHWDLQGRKPDQRYTEAGGQGAVAENIALNHGFVEGQSYNLAMVQRFPKSELERIQGLFFNEVPPHDGHRRNILDPNHNKVGIGLTLAQPGNRVTCSQEFVNQYGSFSQLPSTNSLNKALTLEGKLQNGLTVYAVDIYREDSPQAMARDQIRYPVPYTYPTENVAHIFPPPYKSEFPIKVTKSNGVETFSLEVKPGDKWKPGLYFVAVWAKKPDSETPILCCTHTVDLKPVSTSLVAP